MSSLLDTNFVGQSESSYLGFTQTELLHNIKASVPVVCLLSAQSLGFFLHHSVYDGFREALGCLPFGAGDMVSHSQIIESAIGVIEL